MEANYVIFAGEDVRFGMFSKLEYTDKELANIVWSDLHRSHIPTITVHENEFKVHDCPMKHQPIELDIKEWPAWATIKYESKCDKEGYLGGRVLDFEDLGCCEFHERTLTPEGMIMHERTFFDYKGEIMFSVCEYD